MRNSLRTVGLSLILWFGLNVGLINAAILNNTEIGYDSIISNNQIANKGINELDEHTISKDKDVDEYQHEKDKVSRINSSGLIVIDEYSTTMESLETNNEILDYEATSNQTAFVNINELTPTSTVPIPIANKVNEFSDNSSEAENESFLPEHGVFAMLLVGLGLLGLTARRRRDIL